jgi:hypothetical protein
VAVSNDGATLFIGAADASTGATGIFSADVAGGNATLLAAVPDPAALAIVNDELFAIVLGADSHGALVAIPVDGGSASLRASGLRVDFPAGVSSSTDGGVVYFTQGQTVASIAPTGGAVTVLDVGLGLVSPGALARARFHDSFALLDSEQTATFAGVYTLE